MAGYLGSAVICSCSEQLSVCLFFFFFNDTATTEIYTLSLHDALPISCRRCSRSWWRRRRWRGRRLRRGGERRGPRCSGDRDRKSTRLNSSHSQKSYAGFCFKKKNQGRQRGGRRHQPHAQLRSSRSSLL